MTPTITPSYPQVQPHHKLNDMTFPSEEGIEPQLLEPQEHALGLQQLKKELSVIEELAVKETKQTEGLEPHHTNLKKMLLEHLENVSGLIETLLLNGIEEARDLKVYLNQLKEDIKSSGRTHGTLKIVFGVLTALPALVAGLNTKDRFGYKAEDIRKMSEGIMLMIRQFGEAASVFMQTNQDVMKTDQRFQMDALEAIKGKKRTLHETHREDASQSIRSIDTFHDGFRQR